MKIVKIKDGSNRPRNSWDGRGNLVAVRRCPFTAAWNEGIFHVTRLQFEMWDNGVSIQNAFPHLNSNDREFLMTGITPEVWDDIFKVK